MARTIGNKSILLLLLLYFLKYVYHCFYVLAALYFVVVKILLYYIKSYVMVKNITYNYWTFAGFFFI